MKKILMLLTSAVFLICCNNGSQKAQPVTNNSAADKSAKAQETDVDTSINNIGTDRTPDSSSHPDSLKTK